MFFTETPAFRNFDQSDWQLKQQDIFRFDMGWASPVFTSTVFSIQNIDLMTKICLVGVGCVISARTQRTNRLTHIKGLVPDGATPLRYRRGYYSLAPSHRYILDLILYNTRWDLWVVHIACCIVILPDILKCLVFHNVSYGSFQR